MLVITLIMAEMLVMNKMLIIIATLVITQMPGMAKMLQVTLLHQASDCSNKIVTYRT